MYQIVFVRHGESVWNRDNIFSGWTDVGLSEKGEQESKECGRLLKNKGYIFDVTWSSFLKRTHQTLDLILEQLGSTNIPKFQSWKLNERNYGALQGRNKDQLLEEVGYEQTLIWRRSYATRPPPLTKKDKRYPGNDPLYCDLSEEELPLTECLKDVVERALPLWKNKIVPTILQGKRVLVVAHGNSIRAICKFLDNMTDQEILKLNIPNAIPLVYQFDENMKPIKHFYLQNKVNQSEKQITSVRKVIQKK
ncbi:phosphoglycerate mutase [Anaeramoeba flamelloides]|uniref:phosphoglycerate mutase (2,3-diphosphoglycerate-dependent) n=1 Tax=Anaeramoeba flamelloides TaxID=1746091 RepID=A0AAV8A6I5_9EUKA|nr:phosphoglycerate mutase [Anaeramoeba flamelloides]